jgi:hypothetical protein
LNTVINIRADQPRLYPHDYATIKELLKSDIGSILLEFFSLDDWCALVERLDWGELDTFKHPEIQRNIKLAMAVKGCHRAVPNMERGQWEISFVIQHIYNNHIQKLQESDRETWAAHIDTPMSTLFKKSWGTCGCGISQGTLFNMIHGAAFSVIWRILDMIFGGVNSVIEGNFFWSELAGIYDMHSPPSRFNGTKLWLTGWTDQYHINWWGFQKRWGYMFLDRFSNGMIVRHPTLCVRSYTPPSTILDDYSEPEDDDWP